jgi:hypothetical protein
MMPIGTLVAQLNTSRGDDLQSGIDSLEGGQSNISYAKDKLATIRNILKQAADEAEAGC